MSRVAITLVFEDGAATQVFADEGQTIVQAAQEAGLNLLTDCSNGDCGTCMGQCTSGELDLGDYDPFVLTEDEVEDGAVLCCIGTAKSDVVIELPYDSAHADAPEEDPQQGRIVALEQVAEETMQLVVEVPNAVHFLPGQYVRLQAPGLDSWRSYSMANESDQCQLNFYIRLVSDGQFSAWLLNEAKVGAELEVSAPRGAFFLRSQAQPRLFIAGGTGLGPFLSMLRSMPEQNGAGASAPIHLLAGFRSGQHVFALEELEQLQSRLPHLQVQLATEADAPEGCHTGYATELVSQLELAANTQVYVCGPPPMVEAARTAVLAAGINKDHIYCERFN